MEDVDEEGVDEVGVDDVMEVCWLVLVSEFEAVEDDDVVA